MRTILVFTTMLINFMAFSQAGSHLNVQITRNDSANKVDVYIGKQYFTSYLYNSTNEKPVLYPIAASNGSLITRGFPLKPRPGERIDHPHHLGMWFNFGDVNGLDFWNNSYAIPEKEKNKYGRINHKRITEISTSNNTGKLVVESEWVDCLGKVILNEETTFLFSGNENFRYIQRTTKLKSVNKNVSFGDNKEGLIGIRVNRAFESPSNEPLVFTDVNGNPTKIAAMDNTGVNGLYKCSSGFEGDSVWGTRNKWVSLTASLDKTVTSIAFFDHPSNFGYPAHAHARGYGLFALNNFGQHVFRSSEPPAGYDLKANSSVTFKYLFVVKSGSELTNIEANNISAQFASEK